MSRQILEETLRLWPTAPAFTRRPYKDIVLGGKYWISGGQHRRGAHRDAASRPKDLGR